MLLTVSSRLLQSNQGRESRKENGISAIHNGVQNSFTESPGHERTLGTPEVRVQVAGVKRNGDNTVGLVASGKLSRVQVIAELARKVLRKRALLLDLGQVLDEILGADTLGGGGGDPDDADGIGRGGLCGRDEDRGEVLGEGEGADTVHAELQFVALLGLGALLRIAHASVVDENMELPFLAKERFGGGFDGGEIGKVKAQKDQLSLRTGSGGLDVLDRLESLLLRAGHHVDFGALGIDHAGDLLSHSGIGAGDNDNLVPLAAVPFLAL